VSAQYRIVRCRVCGLEFADPMKSAEPDWYAVCSIDASTHRHLVSTALRRLALRRIHSTSNR